ncbi:hypothetical protein GCM10010168_46030 [Actinoplanes ianthinogenes]|uniref:Lipoprotein n=1 Tax=Actinoplanes ianthinogenes TaxID=122358 RepID=A0ABM7LP92_9ACTN|nr:hypothetical protein [Actinoplanes ianthinogenes]BCJ41099.1 hypothetical protein Aiant_17560 [Actinoplanes ianthinogenes]GGR22917.1 hypothetical protein GCM10010168_46030 [Actinoplanes ianthinogenes]
MRRFWGAAAAAVVLAAGGCSGEPEPFEPTDVVKLDEGTIGGAGWTLVTFHDEQHEICLELRDAGMRTDPELSGGCGPWDDRPSGGRYLDGKGPGRSEFAYGLLTAPAAAVTATAPGHDPVTVAAKPMPAGTGAAKFFVITFPDPGGAWTYTAQDAAGAPVPLGPG